MLRDFLDRFGFDYEFVSASDRYNSGAFDDALRNVLRQYDAIQAIMLPTLREERRLEEAPAAYKKIGPVIDAQETEGLIRPLARLRPWVTFKA